MTAGCVFYDLLGSESFEDRLFKCNQHFYRWSFILRNSRRMIMPYEKKKINFEIYDNSPVAYSVVEVLFDLDQ